MVENILLLVVGFFLLVKGADFLVSGASSVAKKFHIPTLVIGLTIVAVGTSMPELVVSTFSALGGQSDISMGNVVGSNIVNLLFILGLCAVIKPLEFKKQTKFIENFIAIFATVVLFILSHDNLISRVEGIILMVCCLAFIAYNIFMAVKYKGEDDGDGEEIKVMPVWKSVLFIIGGIAALKFGGDFVVKGASTVAEMMGISQKIIGLTIIAIGTSLPELVTSVTATRRGEVDLGIGNVLRISNI